MRSFTAALLWNHLGGVAKAAAQIVVQIWLARILGPSEYGAFALSLAVIGLGWILAEAGVGSTLIRRESLVDSTTNAAYTLVLCWGVAVATVIWLLSDWLAVSAGYTDMAPLVVAAASIIPLQALTNIPLSLLRRDHRARDIQTVQIASYIALFALPSIALAERGWGVWSMLIGFSLQTVGAMLIYMRLTSARPAFQLKGCRELCTDGLRLSGANLANWAFENVDRFVIGRQWGVSAVGSYSAALGLIRGPAMIYTSAVHPALFAEYSRNHERDSIRTAVTVVVEISLLLGCAIGGIVFLCAGLLAAGVFGPRWSGLEHVIRVCALVLPGLMLSGVLGSFLWATGALKEELRIQLSSILLLVVGLFLLRDSEFVGALLILPLVYAVKGMLLVVVLMNKLDMSVHTLLRAMHGSLSIAVIFAGCAAAASYLETPESYYCQVGILVVGAAVIWRYRAGILSSALLRLLRISPRESGRS